MTSAMLRRFINCPIIIIIIIMYMNEYEVMGCLYFVEGIEVGSVKLNTFTERFNHVRFVSTL